VFKLIGCFEESMAEQKSAWLCRRFRVVLIEGHGFTGWGISRRTAALTG
jgi:hypothetical protein